MSAVPVPKRAPGQVAPSTEISRAVFHGSPLRHELYRTVHESKLSSEEIAWRLGVSPSYLYRAVLTTTSGVRFPADLLINLMRLCDDYRIRGVGSYRGMAYERKGWSIEQLCQALVEHGHRLGITYGWGRDDSQGFNPHVLYVDLPQGQVSFHSPCRYTGPDYPGQWDGMRMSAERIIAFADFMLAMLSPHECLLEGLSADRSQA